MATFGDYAVKLSKTPLGIIALFVLFTEVIAALVVHNVSNLSEISQLLVVLFIVLFPILVVVMFWHLLVSHNMKLYAPSEFPNHSDFIEANRIGSSQILREFKKEIISEVEKSVDASKARMVRGNIEFQAQEFARAVELVNEYHLKTSEILALHQLGKQGVTEQEAKDEYGNELITKLRNMKLVDWAETGETTIRLSELAIKLFRLLM